MFRTRTSDQNAQDSEYPVEWFLQGIYNLEWYSQHIEIICDPVACTDYHLHHHTFPLFPHRHIILGPDCLHRILSAPETRNTTNKRRRWTYAMASDTQRNARCCGISRRICQTPGFTFTGDSGDSRNHVVYDLDRKTLGKQRRHRWAGKAQVQCTLYFMISSWCRIV